MGKLWRAKTSTSRQRLIGLSPLTLPTLSPSTCQPRGRAVESEPRQCVCRVCLARRACGRQDVRSRKLKTLFRPRAHANGFYVCLPTHTHWCAVACAQNLQASVSVKQGVSPSCNAANATRCGSWCTVHALG